MLAALMAAGAVWESTTAAPDVEVVVELASPPLAGAAATAAGRTTQAAGSRTARLDLASATSRAALTRIRREQATLEQRIRAAIPSLHVQWRYEIVLNGLAVVVPADRIAALERIAGVSHVTRSVAYRRQLDTAPAVIGTPALWGSDLAATGQGIRIAILDDGIAVDHPFFSPDGFTAPAGFPRGAAEFTSAKVIVARAFPAANASWKFSGTPFDPENSEHGMHVAGIAAGNHNVAASVGGQERTLSGVAPGAFLGNYKVLTTPTPGFGLDGNAPEIAAGIEAAVKDGMDVINLSLGEPEIAPERDLVVLALSAAARAGVIPVVAAGNDFDVVGYGSVNSPGTTPEAITVAAATKDGLLADFSSAGPAPISLRLKPDVTAPGVNIYSSYPLRETSWSSLSGTSMASPVVAGAAALLRQRHPSWTVQQIKSALTSTGTPAYEAVTTRKEAPPTRQGGGMIDLEQADKPLVFTRPTSVSFGLVAPGTTVVRTIEVTDAGGGGEWLPTLQFVQSKPGVRLALPAGISVPGTLTLSLTVNATAAEGEASGFVVLTSNNVSRRIAFWARVARPRLASEPHETITKPGVYSGNTRGKLPFVSTYRFPDAGPALGIPTVLPGPEQVFRVRIIGKPANFGVVVLSKAKGVDAHPRVVVAGNENRLTGMAGLPVDLNPYRNQFGAAVPVAGALRPLPGLYDIVFDTPSAARSGPFTFRYWVNDVMPPAVRLTTPTVLTAPNATLELLITDAGSGVDPAALTVIVDANQADTTFDTRTGKTTVKLPPLGAGAHKLSVTVADFQETKNMESVPGVLPNTTTFATTFTARTG